MILQAKLEDLRPTVEERDAWIWRWVPFSAKAIYGRLRGQSTTEDAQIIRRCRIIWKRRLPLKIRLFAWLLLRRRLMTRTLRQRMYPDSPVNYPLCNGGAEDCDHLFFQCPLTQETWQSVNVDRLGITSTEAFWASLSGGFFRREADWRCIFAVLWAIWTHRNDVIFRDANPSGDAIRYAVRGYIILWFRGGLGPSSLLPWFGCKIHHLNELGTPCWVLPVLFSKKKKKKKKIFSYNPLHGYYKPYFSFFILDLFTFLQTISYLYPISLLPDFSSFFDLFPLHHSYLFIPSFHSQVCICHDPPSSQFRWKLTYGIKLPEWMP